MDEFAILAVVRAERSNDEKLRLKRLRDSSNPFELPVNKFIKLFRIPNTSAMYLYEQLQNHPELNGPGNIPKHLMILASLHFYADGSYQTPVGSDSIIALSQPSLSRALQATSNAIVNLLAPKHIKFPTTPEEKQSTIRDFQEKFNMPNVLGAIDGTHVAIFKPPNNDPEAPGVLFYNRKGYYSINCQVVANARGLITSVNPNFPGSTHDSAIWRASDLSRHLEREYISGEQDQWLLGDKGYPLLTWLMTPVSDPQNEAEQNYNRTHILARNMIEKTFGRLKNKFRCLHRHRTLHYKPKKAAKIIVACCTIYNMFSDVLSDDSSSSDEDTDAVNPQFLVDDDGELNYLTMARTRRQQLMSYFQ